jgi:beta-lactamase superfamily II metal-dependent hydrolase
MQVHIFDVEHGECNIIETPTGHTILIGAGHNSSTNWRPSDWLQNKGLGLTHAILNHLDEDHLSDLPNFEPEFRPTYITRNFDVDPLLIFNQKQQEGGVGNGFVTATHWSANIFTGPRIALNYGM